MRKVTFAPWCAMFFLLGAFNGKAQEKNLSSNDKQTKEYIDYMFELQTYQKLHKGKKDILIPCPKGTDPAVSFQGNTGNMDSWNLYHKTIGNLKQQSSSSSESTKVIVVQEAERANETTNDFLDQAVVIPNFGSGKKQSNRIKLAGVLGLDTIQPNPTIFREEKEDNHSFSTANFVKLEGSKTTKIEADLKNLIKRGTLSGDIDVYEFPVIADHTYIFNISDKSEGGNTNLTSAIYEGENNTLLSSFNFEGSDVISYNSESFSGTIKLAVLSDRSFRFFFFGNPNTIYPLGDEISYELAVNEIPTSNDRDFYSLQLKKGDVIGVAGVSGLSANVGLLGIDSGSIIETNTYAIRKEEGSPLPTVGEIGFHYVIPEDGEHILFLRNGLGSYDLDIMVTRPGNEQKNSFGQQIIFLNMAGAAISRSDFFEGVNTDTEIRNFSSLQSFLPNFGLDQNRDIRPLAKKITDNFTSKIDAEIVEKELNPNHQVSVLSDFGNPKRRDQILRFLNKKNIPFSRLIIGGTRVQLDRNAIGISSAIDVGNFDLTDNGIVLLDQLSDSSPNSILSINNVPLAEGASKVDLVATVIGNIAAHEAGHFLGNWHCFNQSGTVGIMDAGGEPVRNEAGVPEGSAFGDDDNFQVSFIIDEYSRAEALFSGFNETDTNVAFALTTKPNQLNSEKENFRAFFADSHFRNEINSSVFIQNYPNPQSINELGQMVVKAKKDISLKFSLFDLKGNIKTQLFEGEIKKEGSEVLKIDPNKLKLEKGYYIVKLTSDFGEKNHKILIY